MSSLPQLFEGLFMCLLVIIVVLVDNVAARTSLCRPDGHVFESASRPVNSERCPRLPRQQSLNGYLKILRDVEAGSVKLTTSDIVYRVL